MCISKIHFGHLTMSISNITTAQLRILVAIVDETSFSAAAARIGMTQSGASQAIRVLETALGAKLLERGRGGVVPTEIGRTVLQDARDAVLAIERMQQRCAAAAGLQIGKLRIGSVASAAARILPQVLAPFRRHYPGVQLTMLEGTDREILQWVETGIVDVGLTSETSPEIDSRVIVEDDFLLLVNRYHALSKRRRVKLREIADQSFLMSGSGCEPAIRQLFAASGAAPRVTLTIRDTATLVEMVLQGVGVTLMPELAIPKDERRLRRISLEPRGRRRLLAIMRSGTLPPPVAEKFVRLLSGRIRAR
jgi:DNA-binding transcriptional LysR family regulator